MDHRICLKIKLKSLAEEARIIRREEEKSPRHRKLLSDHRRGPVRSEARNTHLAYGFLRGRTWEQIEPTYREEPDWKRVRKMVQVYGAQWNQDIDDDWPFFEKRRAKQLEDLTEWINSRCHETNTATTPTTTT